MEHPHDACISLVSSVSAVWHLRTQQKVNEVLGTLDTTSSLAAFEKMEEKGEGGGTGRGEGREWANEVIAAEHTFYGALMNRAYCRARVHAVAKGREYPFGIS